jgi:hypothetical protein
MRVLMLVAIKAAEARTVLRSCGLRLKFVQAPVGTSPRETNHLTVGGD